MSLAPALVAACLDFVRFPARRAWLAPAVALLWTLLLLGGDPQTAGLAGLMLVRRYVRDRARMLGVLAPGQLAP